MAIFSFLSSNDSNKVSNQSIEPSLSHSSEENTSSALDTFETVLRELRVPPKTLIVAAVREIFQKSRQERVAVGQQASQLHSNIQMNFNEFMRVHHGTEAFNELQEESRNRLLKSSQQ